MIETGDRVKVNMDNIDNQAVIALLNELGGEVVKALGDKHSRIGYLIAYDEKHIPAIERARKLDDESGVGTIFFKVLGNARPKDFPDDPRYYLLGYEDEISQA